MVGRPAERECTFKGSEYSLEREWPSEQLACVAHEGDDRGELLVPCEPDLLFERPALVELVLICGDGPLLEVQSALSDPHQLLVVGLHHTPGLHNCRHHQVRCTRTRNNSRTDDTTQQQRKESWKATDLTWSSMSLAKMVPCGMGCSPMHGRTTDG